MHGLDLLAYRSTENATGLMAAVVAAVDKPVIMAGSIGSRERIEIVRRSGAAGFTIGTAALDGDVSVTEGRCRVCATHAASDENPVGSLPEDMLTASK